MKKSSIYILLLSAAVMVVVIVTTTHASPVTGTSGKEVKADNCINWVQEIQAVHLEYGAALASENLYFTPVMHWASHWCKVDGGRKASYYHLMGSEQSIPYGLRN